MSVLKIVVPEATQNRCANPSAEIAGNAGAVGGGTWGRVDTYQFFDVYNHRVQTAANDEGARFGLRQLTNNIHYVTMRVRGTLPAAWDWSLNDANYTAPVLLEDIDGDWSLYGLQFPAVQANNSVWLYVRQNGAGAGDFYIDGIQVEQKEYWTTYCDGTRPGCWWDGAPHAGTSQRSDQTRAGGRVQDLQDDYYLNISGFIGTGMAPVTNIVDSYALLPGGALNAIKVQSRVFTVPGTLNGTSTANLHARRNALLNILKPNAVPEDASGPQPVRLRYTGAAVQKQIAVHYEGGLEASIEATLECWEKVAIRFLADDPYWYEIGDSADVLDSNDTATLRYVTGRLRATGQWDDLGLAAPGANGPIYDIAIGPDGNIYIGGDFTGLNGTGGAGSIDYVGMYDPQAGTWAQVGAAADFTDIVYVLHFGPDGTLYAGGRFNVAGGSIADYLAEWNGANWATVGVPVAGTAAINQVEALTFGLDGILYVGGTFTDWANIGNADHIVSWNGAAYAALGTGMNLSVITLDTHPNGNIYAGGSFTNAGGVAVHYIAVWNVTTAAWATVGVGFNNIVYSLVIDRRSGLVYIGGAFTDLFGGAGGNYNYIALWNGTAYTALGDNNGTNGAVWHVSLGPDGFLYAGGTFTQAGSIILADRVAKWNGASWAHLDVDLPAAPIVRAITAGASDPVVVENYDLFLGYSTTGAGFFAGDLTVANDGTEKAFPKFIISRTGGTTAILEEIRNETTGLELLFDYGLLDGETLTIDLTPTNKSIVSNFFGPRLDAVLAACSFGNFALRSGNNLITCFVATDATVTAFIVWDDKYWSQD